MIASKRGPIVAGIAVANASIKPETADNSEGKILYNRAGNSAPNVGAIFATTYAIPETAFPTTGIKLSMKYPALVSIISNA